MFKKGDRVILVNSWDGFSRGAEGIVLAVGNDGATVTVKMVKDWQGGPVTSPGSLLPVESSYFVLKSEAIKLAKIMELKMTKKKRAGSVKKK